jgi:hypothetical protein
VGDGVQMAMSVEASAGDYRSGDQIWLRRVEPANFAKMVNRDVLAPRPGGRFVYGRLIDRDEHRMALLPPGIGHRQLVIDSPPWLAVAEMLVRKL